jgi:tetratricopeptide (TPR) repeat protein
LSVKTNTVDPKSKFSAKWFAGNDLIPGSDRSAPLTSAGSEFVAFKLEPPKPWSAGNYKAEVYVNDALKKTVGFTVSDSGGSDPTLPPDVTIEQILTEGDRLTFNSKFDEAINLYKQGASRDPKNATVLARWGRALLFQQKLRESIEKLEEATKLDPRHAEAWGYLALGYDWTYRFDDALNAVNKGLEHDRNSPELHAFKAEIIFDRSEDLAAAESEVNLARSFSQNKSTVQRAISNVAFRKSNNGSDQAQVKIAEDAMKRAIDLEPNLYLHYYELGVLYVNLNKIDQAIEVLTKANNLYGGAAQTHFALGRAYQLKRQCDKAVPEFRQAISIDPNYQPAKESIEACR